MKNIIIVILTLLFCSNLFAQNQKDQELMEKLMLSAQPNENHEFLAGFVGDWKQNFIRSDRKDESSGIGRSHIELIFGGRFLEIKSEQTIEDQRILSIMYIGYSVADKKYFIFGIDALGTGYMVAQGDYDKKQKEFVLTGSQMDPMTSNPIPLTIKIRLERENKFVYEVFNGEGKNSYRAMMVMYIKSE